MDNRSKWEDFKMLSNNDAGLAVLIRKLPLKFPRYSYQIGSWAQGRDDQKWKFFPFIKPNVKTDQFVVSLHPLNIEALSRLIAEAERTIYDEMQRKEDDEQVWRENLERRNADHGKKTVRQTGKTARKRGHA